jgi:DNA-binding PadR family transcriptional regulator
MHAGVTSPITGALLGLLLERSGYGYELAQRLSERMGPAWRLTPSSIYPVLERLEAEQLVQRRVKEMPTRQRQRQRVVYHATDAAADAFQQWLARPARKEPIRTELLAKLGVARPEDIGHLLAVIDTYELDCLALLEATAEQRATPSPEGSWEALLAEVSRLAATQHLQAELDWIRFAREQIREFSTS